MKKYLRYTILAVSVLVQTSALAATSVVNIVDNAASSYTIVYKDADTKAKAYATELQTAIENKTGVKLELKTDATAPTDYEIVLGPTNARGEVIQQNLWLAKFGYRIVIVGKKVVITANDHNHMVLALTHFEENVLKDETLAGTGFLNVTSNNTHIAEYAHTQATLRTILANGIDHEELTTSAVYTLPKDGSYNNAQGICSDGEYVYFVMRPGSTETKAKLYKVRISDWTLVDKSTDQEVFNSGHCNDMCYDYVNRQIICLGWNKNNNSSTTIKTYTTLDPSTLKVIKRENPLPNKAVEIDYNKETGKFALACGTGVWIVDGEMKNILSSHGLKETDGWTEQGMGTDAQFMYSPRNKTNGSSILLVASEWETGKWVKNIKVKMSVEPESMIEVNGNYYINCYNGSGSKLYKINIDLKYTTALAGATHHRVLLNTDGGENAAEGMCFVADQGNVVLIPNPTRAGYTFAGWSEANHCLMQPVIPNATLAEEITFDGTSTYYDLGRDYMYTDALTVNLWAYMADWSTYATGNMRMISCTDEGGWNIEPTATTADGCFRFAGYDAGVGYKQATSKVKCSSLAAGWHMFTLTFNGSNVKGYIDGKLVATSKRYTSGKIGYNEKNTLLVGAEPQGSNLPGNTPCYFSGNLMQLTIANAAISPAGVTNLYAEGRAYTTAYAMRYIMPTEDLTLKALWKANNATTLTIDAAGGTNTMPQDTYEQPAGTSLVVTNPVRTGCEFIGWNVTTSQYVSNYQSIPCSAPAECVFDGSTYYDLGTQMKYDTALTVNVWGYMDDWSLYAGKMRMFSCMGDKQGIALDSRNGYVTFKSYDAGAGYQHNAVSGVLWSKLSKGWHMFTMTFNGRNVRGYIDGELVGVSRTYKAGKIGYHATNTFLLGADPGTGTTPDANTPMYFKGKMKNFAMMHTAISAEEVAALYTMSSEAARYYFPTTDITLTAVWKGDVLTNLGNVDTFGYYVADHTLYVTGVEAAVIDIYAMSGQHVVSTQHSNVLSMKDLQGTFVVRIQDTNGRIYTKQIILP